MIPHGVTPVDDRAAADIFGYSLGYWKDKKHWTEIPGLKLLNRKGTRRRIYSKEQLIAAQMQEARARRDNEMPKFDLPPVPAGEHPYDLLDLEESRLAVPEERRVTPSTWQTYKYGTKTRLPERDFNLGGKEVDGEVVGGDDFWFRKTILDWDANRPGPGSVPGRGRKVGSKNAAPRRLTPEAQERRDRTRQLLDENPTLTAAKLAEELGVHPVHAERLLSAARKESNSVPFATQQAQERRKRTRQLLDENLHGLTASKLAEEVGVTQGYAERLLHAARQDKLRELLAKRPELTVEDVQATFGFSVTAHARTLLDKVREESAEQ
ncbi:hypothetical protein [Streptomyces candidus]|uniref:Uncharacterized protein n=1 Tax=Streptomyces candidus TaxID=67283 RepID=A0A7X0HNG1_9ACTN|nr:hypothetical protein [Streptomyces candidus]MBB6439388.1 hypothetical protein [Streptomyces candidus]GHH54939.1 hypothetical protein GCM10018773_58690 [Streptomyces candidus]